MTTQTDPNVRTPDEVVPEEPPVETPAVEEGADPAPEDSPTTGDGTPTDPTPEADYSDLLSDEAIGRVETAMAERDRRREERERREQAERNAAQEAAARTEWEEKYGTLQKEVEVLRAQREQIEPYLGQVREQAEANSEALWNAEVDRRYWAAKDEVFRQAREQGIPANQIDFPDRGAFEQAYRNELTQQEVMGLSQRVADLQANLETAVGKAVESTLNTNLTNWSRQEQEAQTAAASLAREQQFTKEWTELTKAVPALKSAEPMFRRDFLADPSLPAVAAVNLDLVKSLRRAQSAEVVAAREKRDGVPASLPENAGTGQTAARRAEPGREPFTGGIAEAVRKHMGQLG